MKKYITTLVVCLSVISFAQNKPIPINISLFNESTALPFTRFVTFPIHPGIQVGTEFNYKQKECFRMFQTATLDYFYHNHLAQGIGVKTDFGYEIRSKKGFAFTGLLGIGYMRTFATTKEYVFFDGKYEEKNDRGNSRVYPSLGLEAGYYFKKEDVYSPKVFLRYQTWVEYPYSPGFIPVMTHINLHVGTKIFIRTKKDKP